MSKSSESLKNKILTEIQAGGFAAAELLKELDNYELPHRRMEEWKYSVPAFPEGKYQFGQVNPVIRLPENLPSNALRLVFSGGKFIPEQSSKQLPAGLEISGNADPESVKPFEENFFSKLNAATSGYFSLKITISANAQIEDPILLIHGNNGDGAWSQPFISVEAGANSSASFAEIHEAGTDSVVNLINQVRIGSGAMVHWMNIENTSAGSVLINQTRARLETSAQFRHSVICPSRGFVRNNLDVHISGKGAHADMFGLSLGNGNSHCDHHSFVHHEAENCSSNQFYKGIYAGKSTGVFNGKILVDQAAQKTNAYQSGRNILLSPDARVYAKPQLEIFADDVKCSHGATIGQLEEEPLFYLRSRGLDLATARLLLVRAFASEILMELGNESLREFAENLAIARLDEMTRSL